MIKVDKRLLVIERRSGLYDLAFSDELSLDTENNSLEPSFFEEYVLVDNDGGATTQYASAPALPIASACAAHQASWQLGGFNVEVKSRLVSTPIISSNNQIALYACDLQAGYDGSEPSIDAPPWQPDSIEKMVYVDPFNLEQDQWQNPDHFIAVRDAFILAPESTVNPSPTISQIPADKNK